MLATNRYVAMVLLAAALVAPAVMLAAPTPADEGVQVRVYDSRHKDYHNWDDHENTAWGIYLSNNHKKAHEFKNSSKKEQADYWNWRHAHPDHD